MRYLKTLGLLTAAFAVLLAGTSEAGATTITSPTGTAYTGEIHATSEGHVVLQNPIANIECHSTAKGTSLTHGSGVTAAGSIGSLLWGTSGHLNGICTNSWHVTTATAGSLELHWKAEHEGTLTSTGAKIDATRFGVTCVYETNATDIGTFTDSHKTGTTAAPSTATLHVSAEIPLSTAESGFLCGSCLAHWEGSYIIDTPDTLYIDQN